MRIKYKDNLYNCYKITFELKNYDVTVKVFSCFDDFDVILSKDELVDESTMLNITGGQLNTILSNRIDKMRYKILKDGYFDLDVDLKNPEIYYIKSEDKNESG